MGTFNDSVYNDESQGSQSARKGLSAGFTPIPDGTGETCPVKDQQVPGSASRQTQSPYNLYGLAVSQSQAPKENSLTRKESQKENAPAPVRPRFGMRDSQSQVPQIRSRVSAPEPRQDEDNCIEEAGALSPSTGRKVALSHGDVAKSSHAYNGNHSIPCTSLHDQTAISTGAKGRARPLPSHSNNLLKRPRSPSPASQDSFAALPRDIQEKKYMKQSRTFQMPLSELGRIQGSATEEPPSDEEQDEFSSFTSDKNWARTRFRDLSVSRTGSQPPTQPQDSQDQRSSSPLYSGSCPQAQRQDDDDDDNFFPTDGATRALSSPRLPTSSRLETDSEHEQSFAFTGAVTQLTDAVSPVAVATQSIDDDAPVPPLDIDIYHQSGITSTTSGPQSVLSMVNPNKRWRFQGNTAALAQAQALHQHTQALYEPLDSVAGPSAYEETQPSEVSNLPETGRPIDSNDGAPHGHTIEETQPSESSNLPNAGRLLDDSRSSFGACDDSGATQPTTASNLPATGLEVDPVIFREDDAPGSLRAAEPDYSEAGEVPETEPSQCPGAPSSSPEVPLAIAPAAMPPAERPRETEEKESESQDIPLAEMSKHQKTKPPSKPLPREDSGSTMPPPRKRTRTDLFTSKRSPIPAADSSIRSEDMIIPSSDPRERQQELLNSGYRTVSKGTAKGTPTPITPAVRLEDHDHDESDALSDRDQEEVLTELADEDMEESSLSTRKRRRGTSSALKASARSIKTNTSTPPTRSSSRVKSTSLGRGLSVSATRVLALWKQDSHYYVGTVYSEESPGQRYVVRFDDGTEDAVDLSKLRRCDLRQGDYVLIKASRPVRAEVADASQCNTSERQVVVRFGDGGDGYKEEVDTKDIMIPSRSVISKWADRTLTADQVVTLLRPKLKQSPTPSKLSEIASWSKSTKGMFARTGFILTTSPGMVDWDKERGGLETQIKSQGGHIFEDWCRVFSMEGMPSLGGKRWVLEKGEIKLEREELERVFLLADDACHKPKFLIALALGIPCVKFGWLYDSVAEMAEREWQPYLLPAGTSEQLNARISQTVDVDWGNCPEHVRDIMDNRVPFKLFGDMNILCILADIFPGKNPKRPQGNSDIDRSREAARMIPRILLCMGAARVEAVDIPAHASCKLDMYDYVVVKDADEARRHPRTRDLANCVTFPWVKECLITGRTLPRD
ncbi:uncharacterized protein PHACADRAFT_184039 [Phanerochaete carnosa HHB-10118-sp]|uniref:BRCT domain-containing protein n=1 Tax=Phanerochaete carnosa (strain HHB-10118-sp) TaxID=650164 RepID=K5VUK8_PHACS|nr:uncharacterized protein PHACADRAFT_184039 [Phanerochaete carnosa HHB-10118-sp]EKM55223.1 hypothetical protein PHACADRAFT_184039 [Phanerochaete carnosa HHB-10118-sp]